MMRHHWNEHDCCTVCGLFRSGCSAGRTGFLTYYAANGATSHRAGPCTPKSPMLVETALRRAATRVKGG